LGQVRGIQREWVDVSKDSIPVVTQGGPPGYHLEWEAPPAIPDHVVAANARRAQQLGDFIRPGDVTEGPNADWSPVLRRAYELAPPSGVPERVFLFFQGERMAPGIEFDEQAAAFRLKLMDPGAVNETPPHAMAIEYRAFEVKGRRVWDSVRRTMVSVSENAGDWNTDPTPPVLVGEESGGRR
jgi:hypothetical protein